MGESALSACLRRSFSHPSDASSEFTQGDPIRALTESTSFGRFMSETLDWEKFSTFSQNRYLEEVEKFSKPGAVAEKKAYFEAHFKRRAAMRAAAVAEETSMASNDIFETETTLAVRNDCSSIDESQVANNDDANECNSAVETSKEQAVIEENHNEEKFTNGETSTLENANFASEKMVYKESSSASSSKKRRTNSSSKSSSNSNASKLSLCPSKPSTPVQVRNSVDISSKKVSRSSNEKKRRIPNLVHMSMNFVPSDGGTSGSVQMAKDSSSHQNSPMRILKKAADQVNLVLSSHKRHSNSALQSSTPKDQSITGKQATIRIGNSDAIKKSAGNPNEKKKPTSKSLHMSMNFASCANETSKTSIRMPRDLSKPVQTRTKAPVNVELKHPSKVLQSEDKSSSKPSNPSRSKVQPFSFRSDERATKRKEFFQMLEENSKEPDKVQMQTRPKVKAVNRFSMFKQRTGLKAELPKDLSHESQCPSNHIKKIPLTRPRSPKLGRKPSPNTTQDASSRPSQRHSINSGNSKRVLPKNNRSSMEVTSLAKNRHENASPNIQLSVVNDSISPKPGHGG